jgi:uncharacterized membrane protein YqaE (UPF0057 family)
MDNKVVVIIVSILLPPLAVFLKKGAGQDLIINIVLTLLWGYPGHHSRTLAVGVQRGITRL